MRAAAAAGEAPHSRSFDPSRTQTPSNGRRRVQLPGEKAQRERAVRDFPAVFPQGL